MLTESEQMAVIQRVLDGDIEGFSALVTAFQESALRMAFAITGDRSAAEDVVQESFVSAFRHLRTYDANRATFPGWLHGIVRNSSRNFLRQRKSRGADKSHVADAGPEPAEAACPRPGPADALGIQERMNALDAALASLPAEWRRAFTLTEIEGIPYAEAAIMEGVPIGTIRSRVHRSRIALQTTLARNHHPTPSHEA